MPCGNAALQWMCGQGVRGDYKKVFIVQTDFRQLVEDMIRKLPVEDMLDSLQIKRIRKGGK